MSNHILTNTVAIIQISHQISHRPTRPVVRVAEEETLKTPIKTRAVNEIFRPVSEAPTANEISRERSSEAPLGITWDIRKTMAYWGLLAGRYWGILSGIR